MEGIGLVNVEQGRGMRRCSLIEAMGLVPNETWQGER
jgi:hypothetical protein